MNNTELQIIKVNTLPINLSQFLKWAGAVFTGGEAKEIVKNGLVKVNGEVCTQPGHKLQVDDIIEIIDEVAYKLTLS